MKSLSAKFSRFPARLPLATVKALVPVAVAASLLMATGLVQAAAPTAGFDWSPTVPRVGQTATFNGSAADEVDGDTIDSITWDFGGGATDSGASVQHAFASPGQKSVTMTVTDSAGESTQVTHALRVNAPPSASFTVSPSPVSVNQSVSLNASGTNDDAAIANSSYEWDLDNDGQYDDAVGQQLSYSFPTSGLKTIGLRVTDSDNESDTASRTVTVVALNSPPQAAFGFSPNRPNVNQTVSFDGTSSTDDQQIPSTGYDWDLDNDGQYDDATGPTPTTSFPTPGSRTVGLRVTDSNNVTDTTSHALIVNAPPSAAFTFGPSAPVTGQVVSFNSSGSSDDLTLPDTAFDWDLDGDGQYETSGRTPSMIYTTAGTRTVRLRVTDAGNVSAVATSSVSVTLANTPPVPAFVITPASPDVGDQVSVNAATTTDDKTLTAGSYAWDLDGDGQFDDATGITATTSFATAGAKTIALQVMDSDGVSAAISHSVTVLANATPVARATFTPARPNPGATVTFNASTSTDDDPIPANAYSWDFNGDGVFTDATGLSPTTTFATSGAKSVTLRVTDADGAAGPVTVSVPVNRAPSAAFSFNPQTPRVGETVTFTSGAADDVALPTTAGTISWDLDNDGQFDDGSAATATRAYTSAGDQTVRMRVQDAGGLVTIGSRTFPVQQFQPTASFTSSPAHPLPGQTVTFRSTSTPSAGSQITAQEWDFDGISGIDATGPVVTTIYRTAGRRTVTLKVTDTQGFDITTAPVAVNAPPIAAFRVSPTQPYVGDPVTLVSVSGDPDGPLSTETWDLDGDGQYDDATGKTTSKTFTTAGAHTVRLRVVDSAGAASSAAVTMNVRARPVPPVTSLPQLNARVRVTAQRGRSSTRILTLGVRAPRGAMVKVKCIGKGCPKRTASSTRSKGKALRMHWLEHRLRAGTRITISVTRSGYIGSYTSLLVRRSKGVSRDDLCLLPDRKKPGRCPS